MIGFNSYDLNNKNVSFGTKMGSSAKRAIRKLYKGQEIPQSIKEQIQSLKNDGINAKITAEKEFFAADKKAFGINKNGIFQVKTFKFIVNILQENRKLWLLSTNDPKTFETLFTRFELKNEKMPAWEDRVIINRES